MKLYKYVYACVDTGLIHDENEHHSKAHKETDCYAIKSQEVRNLTPEEVELWLQKRKEEKDKGNPDMIDFIQLDKDFNAWLDKRQLELYGTPDKD